MPKKSATEVTLDMICREIKELKEEQKQLRADINKGKGAIWLLDYSSYYCNCIPILF
jgi:hypothetical protein